MYRNIMFDLDGTVTDSGRAIVSSVEYALSHFGYENQPEEKLHSFIGPSLYDSFTREYQMTDDGGRAEGTAGRGLQKSGCVIQGHLREGSYV